MNPFVIATVLALALPTQALAQAGQAAVGAGGAWTCDPSAACAQAPAGPRIVAGTGTATGTGGPPAQASTACPGPLSDRDKAAIASDAALKQYFLAWWPEGCPGGP